jgi:hypothetical protein
MRKLLIGFVVVVVIAAALYFRLHRAKAHLETAYAGNREVTVWSTTAQVRSAVTTVNFGDRLDVVDRFGDQVQVRTASGATGWVNEHDLLTTEFWNKAKELNIATGTMPVEARGHTRVLSNMHLEPGRDTARIRQVNKNAAVDLFERRALEVPAPALAKAADQESAAGPGPAPDARKEDWWLVRAHLPDRTEMSGWILGRFIDLDVPAPLPDYASAAAMRIVAWFELNRVADETGEMKPQYLVVGVRGGEGQTCDFTMMRAFTWGKQRERYETAFVESDVCGQLPVKLTQTDGGDVSFAFNDLSGGTGEQRLYRMHQTIVRRVREDGAPALKHASAPKKSKKSGLTIRNIRSNASVPAQ